MKALQILGLILAFLLLFPGLCFFGLGSAFVLDSVGGNGGAYTDTSMGLTLAGVGIAIFVAIWFLVRYAFRKPPT